MQKQSGGVKDKNSKKRHQCNRSLQLDKDDEEMTDFGLICQRYKSCNDDQSPLEEELVRTLPPPPRLKVQHQNKNKFLVSDV